MEDLIAHARRLGAAVHFEYLDRRFAYTRSDRVIVVNLADLYSVQRVSLAHECGHVHCGHWHTINAQYHARQERQADEYAAMLLISPPAYAAAERAVGPDLRALAQDLGVSVRIVQAWQRTYCAGRFALLAG